MKVSKEAILSDREVGNPGCGVGTENACFALTRGGEGWVCLGKVAEIGDEDDQLMFNMNGITLGWRVNVDPADRKAWCSKRVLRDSKVP